MKRMFIFPVVVLVLSADASPLFDDDSILDVTLSGPITTLVRTKRDPEEIDFTITVDGVSRHVGARVRGKSRLVVCPFPPIRLDFNDSDPVGTIFAGEGQLKLVTHCRNGNRDSQNSILNEFTAYRVFNLISDKSYRVRLLRIRYEDTDGKQKNLDEPHYGYLVESDKSLAERFGGEVAKLEAVRFGDLDMQQTARLNIFQYLLGNRDWSFVTAEGNDTCCHNIDLLEIDGALTPVPYDFDLAALTRANYSKRFPLIRSTRREYRGYCRTPVESVEAAIAEVQGLRDQLMSAIGDIPVMNEDTQERRELFAAEYFDEAANADALLVKMQENCVP